MSQESLSVRITVNPKVLVGKPTIRGMRISVEQILKALAAGIISQFTRTDVCVFVLKFRSAQ